MDRIRVENAAAKIQVVDTAAKVKAGSKKKKSPVSVLDSAQN